MKVGKRFFIPNGEHPPRMYPVSGSRSFIGIKSHFLLPGNPNHPVMQIKVLESDGDEKLVELIPKDITFYVAVDGKEVFYTDKPKKIRVTGRKHRELVIGITKLDTPQRVLTIE